MGEIIDGKAISQQIIQEVTEGTAALIARTGVQPCIAVVLVGDDPGSQIYVRNKKRTCEKCGIKSIGFDLPATTTQPQLMKIIHSLNENDSVHGILVQLPLPGGGGLDEREVLLTINPEKDVDGFHPINVGKFLTVKNFSDVMKAGVFLPCTPHGCIELLDRTGVKIEGADAVVIGRSNLVGKPMSMLLMSKNATVTICHSRTKNLAEQVRRADIVVAAIGSPQFVKGDWIKEGATVIDVGMNRTDSGLMGDVEFAAAKERAAYITPVPGGVGPMTISMLMKNTLESATRFAAKK